MIEPIIYNPFKRCWTIKDYEIKLKDDTYWAYKFNGQFYVEFGPFHTLEIARSRLK